MFKRYMPGHFPLDEIDQPPPYDELSNNDESILPRPDPNSFLIAVMGPTGSGKSTLISKLAGSNILIGHRLVSCAYASYFTWSIADAVQALKKLRNSLARSMTSESH